MFPFCPGIPGIPGEPDTEHSWIINTDCSKHDIKMTKNTIHTHLLEKRIEDTKCKNTALVQLSVYVCFDQQGVLKPHRL